VYEKSLNEAELILRRDKERLLPVRTVWEEILKRSKLGGYEVAALADFSAMLEGDHRFQIIPARVEGEEPDEDAPAGDGLDDAELEQLGFFPEDRVRLITPSVAREVHNEEEEEIGSIRRRAFINQPEGKAKTINKKSATIARAPQMESAVKKAGKRPPEASRRKKRAAAPRTRKSKTRARKKK
jgi:hypothetical protein